MPLDVGAVANRDRLRIIDELGQALLAREQRLPGQVLAVEVEQVEHLVGDAGAGALAELIDQPGEARLA
jgi:hypothetical protein